MRGGLSIAKLLLGRRLKNSKSEDRKIGVFAVSALHPWTLTLCLAILPLITVINLRGTTEAGLVFSVPTSLFVAFYRSAIIPEVMPTRWWDTLLHTQRARSFRAALLRNVGPSLTAVNLPFHVAPLPPHDEDEDGDEAKGGTPRPRRAQSDGMTRGVSASRSGPGRDTGRRISRST